tara:strand:- start:202 stop:531 length:330 start_codon:yes stop_codon:yes gene_type:complete
MKNIISLIKKYKLYILGGLLVIFFFRSCQKSTEIRKLNKVDGKKVEMVDSLNNVINQKQEKIDSFPEKMRIEKINIHLEYDSWISSRDRGQQLMKLHRVVKDNIKELQK